MRRPVAIGLAAALVAVLAISIAVAVAGANRQGGSAPPLTSQQDVSAESGGVTLAISGAEFSGTATFVELSAQVAGADSSTVTRVRIPAEAFVAGNLAPADLGTGIMLIAGAPAVVQRLRPVTSVGPTKVVISFVDVDNGQGARRIAGSWALELKPPADLSQALRVETLTPGDAAEAQGVTVKPLSATRSTTETLVTVALDGPPGIEQLALPLLVGASIDGGPVYGARIAGSGGEPVTFSFPQTGFGKPLEIQFTEFIAAPASDASGARWVDIRLDSLLARQGVTGKDGEAAAVDRADVAATSGNESLVVTGVSFVSRSARLIRFSLNGYFPGADGVTLTLADGTKLSPSGSGSETGSSPTGDIGQGASSFVTFVYRDFDQLLGTVRLTLAEPGSILRDRWKVGFTP